MFLLRVLQLLHILNVRNRNMANDGNLGNFANIVMDNTNKFCFSKPSKLEYDSAIKSLADYKCVTYIIDDDRIKSVKLTHIGAHYISYMFLAFCRSIALPIVVSVITSLITLKLSLW